MAYYSGRQVLAFGMVLALGAIGVGWLGGILAGSGGPSGSGADQAATPSVALSQNVDGAFDYQTADTVQVAMAIEDFSEDERNNIAIYSQFSDAVVNISTEVISYDVFFEPVPSQGSTGSGSIIDKRGYILTNNHVVEGAVSLYVTLSTGDRMKASLVGRDPENDLAVIKIEPGDRVLKTISLGTSTNLRVGQKVIAIGNPFSFDRTMTTGIVSALGRPIKTDKNTIIQGMIQTDASINPGNSGGPLLDRNGNLIGINTVIYTESGGSVGIGFAVPVDTAKRIIPEIISNGSVKRGWIDITPIQIFPELVQYARLGVEEGILVSRAESDSSAYRAGIRGGTKEQAVRYGRTIIYLGGDIILEVDGVATGSIADLYTALEDNKPGERVKVVVLRGGKRQDLTVTLVDRPNAYSKD